MFINLVVTLTKSFKRTYHFVVDNHVFDLFGYALI